MPPKAAQKLALLEEGRKARADPCYFASEILGLRLWEKQQDMVRAAFRYRDTAVPSCHGSGKTYDAAVIALAWVALHPPGTAMVIITSADFSQVEFQIFPYMHTMIGGSKLNFGPGVNKTSITMNGNLILGRTTDNAMAFHGFHAQYILVIRDEFSGIAPGIVESMRGMRATGQVSFLDLMNPVMASGPSVDRCEDPKVHVIRIDGLETPNMAGWHIYESAEANEDDPDKEHNILYLSEDELDRDLRGPWPMLTTKRFIREIYEEEMRIHGSLKPESSWWPKVRGMFPTAGDSMLIQRDWVQTAHTKVIQKENYDVVGCDVAGPGEDETAACWRSGNKIVKEIAWPGEVTVGTFRNWVGPPRHNLMINIDRQGVGWGWYQDLREAGYHVNGLNAGDGAWDKSRFDHAKAEMYWNLRARFQDGEVGGFIDPKTQHQLVNIEWDQNNDKRLIHIEEKKEARKKGKRSPDRAEAMVLCFAASPQRTDPREWRYQQPTAKKKPKGWRWIEAKNRSRREAGLIY